MPADHPAQRPDLVEFARQLRLDRVPPDVRAGAAASLVNIVGAGIGGLEEEATQRALVTAQFLCTGEASGLVVGTSARVSLDQAAFVGGVAAHVLDFDDTHLASIYHPSAVLYGAILPLAARTRSTGEEAMTAWVVGLEVGIRLAMALGMPHYDRGWHISSTAGPVAGAAAAGRLLGLDAVKYANAVNLAATAAAGHRVHFGTDAKSAHVGYAAQRGLHAALLAAKGFTASPGGILGRRGLLEVIGPDGPHDELDRDLGAAWRLLDNRLKPYASGVVTHPAIDLARLVRERLGSDPHRIAAIDLRVHALVAELTAIPEPQTGLEAKFSVRHCFAAGFLRDRAGTAEFSDTFVRSPEVGRLRRMVSVSVDNNIGHMTARVRVTMTDGTSVPFEVLDARGSDARPLTDREVEAKFVDLVAPRTGSDLAAEWFARLSRLDRAPDVATELDDLNQALTMRRAASAPGHEHG